MTRTDRIFGSAKTTRQLRRDQAAIEAGMADLGKALEREIKRQDRAEARGKPALTAGGKGKRRRPRNG